MHKTEKQLADILLFQALTPTQLKQLFQHVHWETFSKNKMIFNEGEKAAKLFFLVRGRLKLYKLSKEGKEQILHIVKAGETFAEAPLFKGARFPAYCQALEKSEVGYINREHLIELIESDSTLAMRMLAILSQKLYLLSDLVENLSLKESRDRLLNYLHIQSKKLGGAKTIDLGISKTVLANMIGTSRENLSRIMATLVDEGILEIKNRTIILK